MCYELLLDRRVGNYCLPESVWCIAAGNSTEDNCGVFEMSAALADRLVHFNVVTNPSDWLDWAQTSGVHTSVITFIKVKPDFLSSNQMQENADNLIQVTPRSWVRVSDVLKVGADRETLNYIISGIIGRAAAAEFFHVLEELEDLPSIKDLFEAKDDKEILRLITPIKTVASLYGLCYSLVSYATDLTSCIQATNILNVLVTIKDKLPRNETQTLGQELIMLKVVNLNNGDDDDEEDSLEEYTESVPYLVYRDKSEKIFEMVS